MKPKLAKLHWCFKCCYPLSGLNHRGIDRARQKRAWRKWEMS